MSDQPTNHRDHEALAGFHEPVRNWFADTLGAPTRAQQLGWPAIRSGESTLLLAPTGSGKTLAAFLTAIDDLMFEPVPPKDRRCRVLYLSPLKALAVDIERNLRAPIRGIVRVAEEMGVSLHVPEIAVRTGDTPARERAAFSRKPADILITTPESLFLLLTSNAREVLRSVRCVIVDEIHALVGSKRGTHLALSLERLEELAHGHLQRIGLSATQRPLEEVARFLGGFSDAPAKPASTGEIDTLEAGLAAVDPATTDAPGPAAAKSGAERGAPSVARPVRIVDAGARKRLDLRVETAAIDPGRAADEEEPGGLRMTGTWPAIHRMLLQEIQRHRSTLIFVNSRRLAERLAGVLNEMAGEELVHAHHGSIAREQRLRIENDLKSGRLPALVATSSLELGIDMGAIDLVIQVEAPPGVSSGLQRIGRAGHRIEAESRGIIIPKHRGDLLACAAVVEGMLAGDVEPMCYPRNPLDVLAQQIVAMVSMDPWSVPDLARVIRRAAPYADLPDALLEEVLDMLSGRYPSDQYAELRPRITWDRTRNVVTAREGARRVATMNSGSIPDRGLYGVYLIGAPPGQGRVGELDEEMVFESRVGDRFLLGASTWRIEEIGHDRVIVSPAPGAPGRMPFWHGDTMGRPAHFGRAIGALSRRLCEKPHDEAQRLLVEEHRLTPAAAKELLESLDRQIEAVGAVPDDRTIVIERCRDELGEWRICLLSPIGSRVLAPWAMAIAATVRDRTGVEPDVLWSDNGIVIRMPDADRPPPPDLFLPPAGLVRDLVIRQLGAGGGARQQGQGAPASALFASRFREAAARALLLPRGRPGKRSPLWLQRKRAADLLHVTARFGSFPIVLEAYRECLRDFFDMPALIEVLTQIETGEVRVVTVDPPNPSPFASALLFSYVANFMYEGDAPLAERRAQALTVDPVQLRQLLGEIELRDLLSADAVDALERRLQGLEPEQAVRHADGLHDLLLRLGDLSLGEIAARSDDAARARERIRELADVGRILLLRVGGEERWVAVEDAARYRDALGIDLPDGLPPPLLRPVADPVGDLVSRYARTHGPFGEGEVARRLGLGAGVVRGALHKLLEGGRVLQGEFRPGGSGVEWCDAEVLASLRRRSLAILRKEVEPVEADAYARFLLAWHGIPASEESPVPPALLLEEVIRRLGAASVPASDLEADILPIRLPKYDSRDLDLAIASGAVLWVGAGGLPPRNGRVRLLFAEEAAMLAGVMEPDGLVGEAPGSDPLVRARIVEHLRQRGASFFPQIVSGVGGFPPDILAALWDLVWAGEVTNDTLQPLREYLNAQRDRKVREAVRRHAPVARWIRPGLRSASEAVAARTPPEACGRWSLVHPVSSEDARHTERAAMRCEQLLTRYGVVTREVIQAEGAGSAALFAVLRGLEDAGRVRRGYFVAGLAATQYALPEAVDRLRAARTGGAMEPVVLAASDPANPYGAVLRWPEREDGRRPARVPGASVVLIEGRLAAWLSRNDASLLLFAEPAGGARAVAEALADVLQARRRTGLLLREIDGVHAPESPHAGAFVDIGFRPSAAGLLFRR